MPIFLKSTYSFSLSEIIMNRYAVFFLCAVSLLSGCRSVEEKQVIIQAPEAIQEEVAKAYESDNAAYGLSLLQGAKERYPDENWDSQWIKGVSLIHQSFFKAVEAENWRSALKYYRSLISLGDKDSVSEWNEKKLEKHMLLKLVKDENPVLGLTLFADQFSDLQFSESEYDLLLKTSETEKHVVSHNLIQKSLGRNADEQELLTTEKTRQLMKGMATVWVDRGIKLEDGLGYPDRVIGSGFFIDSRGYLLTNHHVIESEVNPKYEGYSRLYIRLASAPKEKIPAKVVGWDTLLDLALLKVEYTPGYVFSFTKAEMGPGQHIYAIGSPGGLESTITSGIVSATERRLLQIGDTTQIDVPINHGNSGGPLIDEYGNVVGVVFAGIESFEGINFAIPGKWINLVIDQLYYGNKVQHPWLGVAVYEQPEGLEVLYVFPDSPAASSGIQAGDIITGVGSFSDNEIGNFQYEFLHHLSGEAISVSLLRETDEKRIISYLGVRPDSPFTEAAKKDSKERFLLPLFGFDFESAGATLWERRFRITRILTGMAADDTGLSVNDPFILKNISLMPDQGIALTELIIKKRKAGFIESTIQLGAYIDADYFL